MSMSAVFLELFLSTVGFGLFMYGKKQRRGPHLATGVLMMGFPYVVHGVGLMLTLAAVLGAGLWAMLRFGL
jgi:hypothetical protein